MPRLGSTSQTCQHGDVVTLSILLDLTRTLSRAGRAAPTGIDRVELAWARHLQRDPGATCRFAFQSRDKLVEIPGPTASRLVDAVMSAWQGQAPAERALFLASSIRRSAWFARDLAQQAQPRGSILLNLSHARLEREATLARIVGSGLALVALVHDLIPIEFPEYARPGEAERHRARLASLARHSSGLLCNSEATAIGLRRELERFGQPVPIRVAHLGLDPLPSPHPEAAGPRRLLFVGTIEARKNHAFLLAVLRDLAGEANRPPPPGLVLVGARGWEAEAAVDLIERSERLRPFLTEAGPVSERELAGFYRSSLALVLPSFAEGYGLPLAEALASGCPAIVSDLPALREIGGAVPDYLHPLDGPGWAQAIRDYAEPDSPRRTAQLARLAGWSAPSWAAHFAAARPLLEEVSERARSSPG